jgi:hypothetical protein
MKRLIAQLAKHAVIAMPVSVICMILGGILIGVVMRVVGIRPFRAVDVWYTPFVWWPGLVLGFLVNRRRLHRAACLVWFPGLLWLAYGILSTATAWRPEGMSWMTKVRIDLFPLKGGECGTTECMGEAFYTWPALNSVAYSISAAVALLINQDEPKSQEPPRDDTTLGLR